ncbi:MAG: hypothetical protein ACRENI_12830, partial [Gemmatimonadaceae bacterium]
PIPHARSGNVEVDRDGRPPETKGISIYASVNGRDKLWQAGAAGWVAPINAGHITDVVNAKARTVSLARSRCDELWLVIVHDVTSHAAPSELTPAAAAAEYSAPFDRLIWLYPHDPAQSLDLKLAPQLPT